jgi:hypothetical protein
MILLRVVSTMSNSETSVNIIPEFSMPKTSIGSPDHSFGGVVDFLLTKLPTRYTGEPLKDSNSILLYDDVDVPNADFLLGDPSTALANPDHISGPMTSNIFEAKRDNVRNALPQAIIAAAVYCKNNRFILVCLFVYCVRSYPFHLGSRPSVGVSQAANNGAFSYTGKIQVVLEALPTHHRTSHWGRSWKDYQPSSVYCRTGYDLRILFHPYELTPLLIG